MSIIYIITSEYDHGTASTDIITSFCPRGGNGRGKKKVKLGGGRDKTESGW